MREVRPIAVSDSCGVPRVKSEAQIYYQRNQGNLRKWFDQKGNRDYASPRPVPRCPSPAARQQYEKHRGSMENLFNQSLNRDYSSPRPQPRCPSAESRDQCERHRGCMGALITGAPSPANSVPSHPRAVKPEAFSIAESHKGSFTKALFDRYGKQPLSARPVPKIKPEAYDNYMKNRGYATTLFYQYGKLPQSARPVPNVKPEASENAELDRGKRMCNIISRFKK